MFANKDWSDHISCLSLYDRGNSAPWSTPNAITAEQWQLAAQEPGILHSPVPWGRHAPLSIPPVPPRAPLSPSQAHNWIGQQLTPLRPEQSGTWYFEVVGSNLLLLAAFTENKSHRVNNQLSRVSMSSLCVFVCMFMCIKGCLVQGKIQFDESNLIRGHRSLTGQRVLKWESEGPGRLLLPQKWRSNGTGGLVASAPYCSQAEEGEEDIWIMWVQLCVGKLKSMQIFSKNA